MFALDANAVIHMFKGVGRVAETLLSRAPREVAIPAVVLYELGVGVERSHAAARRKAQLKELVAALQILPFGQAEAAAAAQVRTDLQKRGCPIGPLDTLIAGTAIALGATLVTHNTKEFGRVKGLSIVDWY